MKQPGCAAPVEGSPSDALERAARLLSPADSDGSDSFQWWPPVLSSILLGDSGKLALVPHMLSAWPGVQYCEWGACWLLGGEVSFSDWGPAMILDSHYSWASWKNGMLASIQITFQDTNFVLNRPLKVSIKT